MKNKTLWLKKSCVIGAIVLAAASFAACGTDKAADAGQSSQTEQTDNSAEPESFDKVATSADMSSVSDVVKDGMTPVEGSQIKDGTYDITVDSSSSMFSVTSCKLTVKDGKMTAVMTMGGKGYLYVYMGTGEEAAKAEKSDYIPFVEDQNGQHTFTVPVEALDKGLNCAAFSKNKEMWYDRTLVFRADSLPSDAYAEGTGKSVADLNLADGDYTAAVTLEGGSGRASVQSPAKIHVENGQATATIVWSSSNYDYMIVDGQKYLPLENTETATFEIPVSVFDRKITVAADTTAMSTPHEITYTLYFESASVQ